VFVTCQVVVWDFDRISSIKSSSIKRNKNSGRPPSQQAIINAAYGRDTRNHVSLGVLGALG